MTARVGVVQFPGTNCEFDTVDAINALGGEANVVWHGATDLRGVDAVVVPGGFAHGDYLRPGAIAQFSPVMSRVVDFAASGGPVVGICNGFQVLTELGLLPGALQKNAGLKFICQMQELEIVSINHVLGGGMQVGETLRIPINHFEGNYVCDPDVARRLVDEDRIVLRYLDNPNGSILDIAGICSEGRNVVGMMPHPERATSPLLGSQDGTRVLRALLSSIGDRSS